MVLPRGFFARTPSMIWRIVIICDGVDFSKSWSDFPIIFPTSVRTLFGGTALYNLFSYSSKSFASVVLTDSDVSFHRKEVDATSHFSCLIQKVCHSYFGKYFLEYCGLFTFFYSTTLNSPYFVLFSSQIAH